MRPSRAKTDEGGRGAGTGGRRGGGAGRASVSEFIGCPQNWLREDRLAFGSTSIGRRWLARRSAGLARVSTGRNRQDGHRDQDDRHRTQADRDRVQPADRQQPRQLATTPEPRMAARLTVTPLRIPWAVAAVPLGAWRKTKVTSPISISA